MAGYSEDGIITTVEKVLFLKSIDLFAALPGEDLAQIATICDEVSFDAGEPIFREGETGDALYLVLEGKVRVIKGDRELAQLGERQCVGEMAILDSEPRSATVEAVTDSVLLKLGREDFRDIMAERPGIAQGMIRVLTRRLRSTIQK